MSFYSAITLIIFLCVLTHSTSKYKGVYLEKKSNKWRAFLYFEKILQSGGAYYDEVDAAKKVNKMCDKFQIKRKNPDVDASPMTAFAKKKNSITKYKGVFYNKHIKKWVATINFDQKRCYGGTFDYEIDAVKKVNQLCDELGIERKSCY